MSAFTDARHRMVDVLDERGLLTDPAWRAVFAEMPRENLLHQIYLPGRGQPVTCADPQWAQLIYDPDLTLQVRPRGYPHRDAPAPSVCARLLHGLQLHDRDRVLVIGLTDPYLTVLLGARLGSTHVTAVDPDSDLVASTHNATRVLDLHPDVLHTRPDTVDQLPLNPRPTHLLSAHPVAKIPATWLPTVEVAGVIVTAVGSALRDPTGRLVDAPLVRLIIDTDPQTTGLRADGMFLPGPAPDLGPGPHLGRPAQEFGLSLTVPYPAGAAIATHHYWWGSPDNEILTA